MPQFIKPLSVIIIGGHMPNQAILIKPASGGCNMNCKYCFYYDVTSNREVENYGFMTLETLEMIVKKALDYTTDYVTFIFQGGEPTLVGLNFYKKFIEFVNQYNTKKIKVTYAIQTNGYKIDDNWARFFHSHQFLVGLSMDGPKSIHDLNRLDHKHIGTFRKVKLTADLFTKHQVAFNILSVVNRAVAKHPIKVYNFFKKNGYAYLQFIPCLDEFGTTPGQAKHSLTPEDYGNFLCQIFDLWYEDFMKKNYTSIRFFDNLIQIILGYPPESCDMVGTCSINTVIEADGSVYPCDFYVLDQWKIGNILEDTFEEIKSHKNGQQFIHDSLTLHDTCKTCDFFPICRNGCRRHRELGGTQLGLNYFCVAYKKFYPYAYPRLQEVAHIVARRP